MPDITAGKAGGAAAGLVLGAVLAPLTFGASAIAAGTATVAGTAATGALFGLALGSAIGGAIDPPKGEKPLSQYEILDVQVNTYRHDIPVPIVFGKRRIAGNVIFLGDSYGQVEVVGEQTVGSGKSEQNIDIEDVIYYADFVIGLCEGPIRSIDLVLREDKDITDQEGVLFDLELGSETETVNDIVSGAAIPITNPIPWRRTAKLYYSGRIGNINTLPTFLVDVTGPDLTVTNSGTPTSLPGTVESISFDELSETIVAVTGNQTVSTFNIGSSVPSHTITTIPSIYEVDRAFFNGRDGLLLIITTIDAAGERYLLSGEIGYDASDDWNVVPAQLHAMTRGIDGAAIDETNGVVWTLHNDPTRGLVLVSTDFETLQQKEVVIPFSDNTNLTRAFFYDKADELFYVLYTEDGVLYLQRFDPSDIDTWERMKVGYTWSNPIGLAKVGELLCVFDRGTNQPIHLFSWGSAVDEMTLGSSRSAADFVPTNIADIELWLKASSLATTLTNGQAVSSWPDSSNLGRNAIQGSSTAQPTFRTGVVNSQPVVRFDGTNDYLDIQGGPSLSRQNFTLFVVFKPSSGGSVQQVVVNMRDEPTTGTIFFPAAWGGPTTQAGAVWASDNNGLLTVPYTSAVGSFVIHSAVGRGSGVRVYKNGTFQDLSSHIPGAVVDNAIRIGRSFGSTGYFLNGDVAEIIIYDRALDDEEREQVEDYLREKFRIDYVQAYNQYLTAGEKLVFSNPQSFWYADQRARMFVLDTVNGQWQILHFHWNGDNWSVVKPTYYEYNLFQEESSCAGAVWTALNSSYLGGGISSSYLRSASFDRVSGLCNSPVNMAYYTNDPTTFESRFRTDYVLSTRKQLSAVLRDMMVGFSGFLTFNSGMVDLLIDYDTGVYEQGVTEDDIIEGSFTFQEIPRDEKYNHVTVDSIDERDDYRRVPVSAYANWDRDIYNEVRKTTIFTPGVVRPRQAAIVAHSAMLGFTMRNYACSFRMGAKGLIYEVGDIIPVTHSRPKPAWVKKLMRIVQMIETETEEIELTCVEYVRKTNTTNAFPLQEPQRLEQLRFVGADGHNSQVEAVSEAARVAILEETATGRMLLLGSRPDSAGPWVSLRWLAKWVSSSTPNANFYPGLIPFTAAAYNLVVSTSAFTPSGILTADVTSSGLSLSLACVMGVPPEQNFDVIIRDLAITSNQFGNPNGNGFYERATGSTYNESTKVITVAARGVTTPALAHTIKTAIVQAMYTASDEDGTPQPIYTYQTPVANPGPAALSTAEAVWYIGFKDTGTSSFATTPSGVNNISVVVTGPVTSINLNTLPAEVLATIAYKFDAYYSTGNGEWSKLRGVKDDTLGFTRSGRIAFDIPSDWAKSGYWDATHQFSGISSNQWYWIKFQRKGPQSYSPLSSYFPPGAISRSIALLNQSTYLSFGYHSPVVYFVQPNVTALYDFAASEQGFTLEWKAQPVGIQNQSINLDDLTAYQYTVLNLAGEGTP